MQSNVHIMTFNAGVPQHYNASHHGPGFRIDFEQISECSSLKLNTSVKMNETDSAKADEDDYYDEEDIEKDIDLLSSKKLLV